MNKTKHKILEKAFFVFLKKGYHGTSISDIRSELDIGRATLYHHFANKKDLFMTVINEVYMKMGHTLQSGNANNMTARELIKDLKQKSYDENAWLENLKEKNIGLIDFFMLSSEALRLNPEYMETSKEMHTKAIETWENALKNSIAKGEVRKDIDISETARLFVYAKHGIGVLSTHLTLAQSVSETQKMYERIYEFIKT